MKILYVANMRFPTERAHGAQVAKTCEAFVKGGHTLELWVPRRHTHISEDAMSFYGLDVRFPIRKLFTIDSVAWGRVGFLLEAVLFAVSVCMATRRAEADIYYCRDEIVVAMLAFFGVPVAWESHTGAWGVFGRYAARRAHRVVVISHGLKKFYIDKGIPEAKIFVAPDGVDLRAIQAVDSKESARVRLKLPLDAKIALYVGGIEKDKGTDVIFAASELVQNDIRTVVIGEGKEKLETLTRRFPSVSFIGARPYRELGSNLAAADVLILPSTAQNVVSARFTSPLKLFAYMASGVPIVASDVSSTREILDEETAFLFRADDAVDLASAVRRVFDEPESATQKGQRALQKVTQYAWDVRAKQIADFLSTSFS